MLVHKKAFWFGLLCLGLLPAKAFDLSKINMDYQYDFAAKIRVFHRVAQVNDRLEIYYQVKNQSLGPLYPDFLLQDQYNSPTHDTLQVFILDTLALDDANAYFKLTIKKPEKSLLLISLVNTNGDVMYIDDVQVSGQLPFPDFVPFGPDGLPLLRNYVTPSKLEVMGSDSTYHVFRYRDDFGPASPAMGHMKPIAPRLNIDTAYYITDTLSHLEDYHFYLLQEDTSAETAITLLKTPYYYPKFRLVEELIPPLTYITTAEEIRAMTQDMSRKSFENFWLRTYGNKLVAKQAIREFYQRVEAANELFTDYKQGWETDRGIIYIVFGKPKEVYRSEQREYWRYSDGLEFEFIRISTLFTPSMYSLRRDRSYEELWYSHVGKLREGFDD